MTTVLKILLTLMSWLPLPVGRALGWLAGEWAWRAGSRGARTTKINLRACFPALPEKALNRLGRQSMHHWGMTIFEVPVIWRRGRKSLNTIRRIVGQDLIEAARAEGRGTILLSPHLGNWELAGLWICSFGPTTNLYQPPRRLGVDELIRSGRSKMGATLVATDLRGVSSLAKALKRGEITGILPDMEPDPRAGVFAPFFGVQALTMTLVHSLQQRTGARIIIGFCRRIRGGFEAYFIDPDPAIYDDDPALSAAAMNRTIETLVERAPEQYQWEYKRFKKRPPGEKTLYPKVHSRKPRPASPDKRVDTT
jgi:KDO2-lipid IV(A) lauroyltransferase